MSDVQAFDDFDVESSAPAAPAVVPSVQASPVEATIDADEPAAQATDDQPGPVEAKAETPEQQAERKAGRNSIQARIDKAVAAQREAERRAEAAERRAYELEQARQAREPQQQPASPQYFTGPPPSEDEIGTKYQDYPAFIRATAQWQVAEARAEDAITARQRATYERHEATATQFAERIAKAEESDPDYWTKIDPAVANLRPSSALEPGERRTALNAIADIIFDSEYSTELMARLRAADLQRLSTLPPDRLYREKIGRAHV